MTRFWKILINLAAALAFVLIAALSIGLAAPFLADSIRGVLAEFDNGRGHSGLIYVESPEVYTRQRLVNDRYLQDAWLRGKLTEIEDPGTRWIDTVRLDSATAAVALGGAAAARDGGDGSLAEAASAQLSFENEFDLQSNARDAIRQMILENALDDRHDLSGNTVFGLKFDTAILPGSRARLNPTVIVQMNANPLENLRNPASAYAPYFNLSNWADIDGIDAADRALLAMIDRHFIAWTENLEERLNQQRSIVSDADEDPRACSRPARVNAELLDTTLCEIRQTAGPDLGTGFEGRLTPSARSALDTLIGQRRAIDGALDFVLRLPARSITIGNDLRAALLDDAAAYCTNAGSLTDLMGSGVEIDSMVPFGFQGGADAYISALHATLLRDFLGPDRLDGYPPSEWFDLPPPWAPLFQFQVNWRIADDQTGCGTEFDIQLNPREIPILLLPAEAADHEPRFEGLLFNAGLRPLSCNAPACTEDGVSIWIPNEQQEASQVALDDATFASLIGPAGDWSTEDRLCLGDGYYFQPRPDETAGRGEVCLPGRLATFRIGAYHFLRKMTGVESYTYAAFPRGDVSGVVSETRTQRGAGGTVGAEGASGSFLLGRGSAERRSTAEPSLINFAAGDQHELFDFGWSIIKDGVKEPMIASQLVLVSVPAYLDRIELRVLKGFLDIDRLPADWTDRRSEYALHSNGTVLEDAERTALLERRVASLFEGYESRRIVLKVPPDYGALDGIVIGNNLIGGPRISAAELQACYEIGADGITIAIPGERLWRSTVVTLEGSKASKIEVMPDMRGILASFDDLAPGTEGPDTRLMVWTSEGRDVEKVRVSSDCDG